MPWLHVRDMDSVMMDLNAGESSLGPVSLYRVQLTFLAKQAAVLRNEFSSLLSCESSLSLTL
jgi:hypothetical protein